MLPAKVYRKREWLINHACHLTRCVSSRIMSQILSLLKHKKHRPLDIKLFINPNSIHRHHFETIFSPSIQGIWLYCCCRCVIWRNECLQQLEYYLTFKLNVLWIEWHFISMQSFYYRTDKNLIKPSVSLVIDILLSLGSN